MTETIAVLGVGPSFGLGAAIGRRFARGGFRVFIGGRNTERLAGVADEISALGEEIDNLTFSLVAPLRANHRRCSHQPLLGPLRPIGSISDGFRVT